MHHKHTVGTVQRLLSHQFSAKQPSTVISCIHYIVSKHISFLLIGLRIHLVLQILLDVHLACSCAYLYCVLWKG